MKTSGITLNWWKQICFLYCTSTMIKIKAPKDIQKNLHSLWYFLWSSCWTCWVLAPSGRINPSSLCCRLAGELKLTDSRTDVIQESWEITTPSYSSVLAYLCPPSFVQIRIRYTRVYIFICTLLFLHIKYSFDLFSQCSTKTPFVQTSS